MKKIENANFVNSTSILCPDSPSFSGILAGECNGDVWVNDHENPTLALVYSFAVGGFEIMGNTNNSKLFSELEDFLRKEFFVDLKSKGFNDFEFSVQNEQVEHAILKMFSDKNIQKEIEYSYRKNDSYKIMELDEYKIRRVDYDFISDLKACNYDNPEFVLERLLESWKSYEDFLEKSISFVATKDSEIVGVIIGTGRYLDKIAIDIETKKEHQNKGIASSMTQHFVNSCVDEGLVAQWNCVDSNVISRKTAEKSGFKLIMKKPLYWFDL